MKRPRLPDSVTREVGLDGKVGQYTKTSKEKKPDIVTTDTQHNGNVECRIDRIQQTVHYFILVAQCLHISTGQ